MLVSIRVGIQTHPETVVLKFDFSDTLSTEANARAGGLSTG